MSGHSICRTFFGRGQLPSRRCLHARKGFLNLDEYSFQTRDFFP
jgi:hypothetical protein